MEFKKFKKDGWEERHSYQIQMLWDIQYDINAKYKNFLP